MSGTQFLYTGAIVTYTITVTGLYQLVAIGAQGAAYSATAPGGLGAEVVADEQLTAGTVLSIAVGGNGSGGIGGGGGTFVTLGTPAKSSSAMLVVAGGGGGAGQAEALSLDNAGNAPLPPFGAGGTVGEGANGHGLDAPGGLGGSAGSGGGGTSLAAGGAGVIQNGEDSVGERNTGGSTYPSLAGGTTMFGRSGGFGGGGAGINGAGGGGGGYSGGGAGGAFVSGTRFYGGSGGGGGSFASTSATNVTYGLDPIGANADGTFTPLPAQFDLSVLSLPCFARGTRLSAPCGECSVEQVAVGDRLTLHEGGEGRVVWVGHRYVDCLAHPRPENVWPVRVRAGAFGPGLPAADLLLSPDHALFIDGVLIPVRLLVDGSTVARERCASVEYWHVELERHDILLAHGLPVESFLNAGTRDNLIGDGYKTSVVRLLPEFKPPGDSAVHVWEARGFAPLVIAGAGLDRARARLASAVMRAA